MTDIDARYEERERAFLEELRNRTTVPDMPEGQMWCWCKKCGEHTTDSPYSDCPVCEDKKRRPKRVLSRYLFGELA